jgi:hypothetical protein
MAFNKPISTAAPLALDHRQSQHLEDVSLWKSLACSARRWW